MNKFLIAFSALLAVFSVCDAYGQRQGYGARQAVLGGVAYQLLPRATVQVAQVAPGYGAQVAPGYGAQVAPGYGAQVAPGYGAQVAPGYGSPISSAYGNPLASGLNAPLGLSTNQLLSLGGGYGSNLNLAQRALAIPSLSANYNPNVIIQPSVTGPATPLILPAPVGPGYRIPLSRQSSAKAVAQATGSRANIPYGAASLVPAPEAIIGSAPVNAYAPAPGPVYGVGPAVPAY